MSKIVTNTAVCSNCGNTDTPSVNDRNMITCKACGSVMLLDLHGRMFEPEFAAASTYRVSPYCPEFPDRRESDKRYPIIKDRRARR